MTGEEALKEPSVQLPILQQRSQSDQDVHRATNTDVLPAVPTGRIIDAAPLLTAVEQRIERTIMSIHRGPLPDPETFHAYERALPGAAERILAMAEEALASQLRSERETQAHRHEIEHRQLRLAERSQICALIAVAVVVLSGAWLVAQGQPLVGGLAMGVPLVGLAGAFLYPHLRKQPAQPQSSRRSGPRAPRQGQAQGQGRQGQGQQQDRQGRSGSRSRRR